MTALPEHLRNRGLALAILAAVLLFAWLAFFNPVLSAFEDQRDAREEGLRLLTFYQRTIESGPALQARVASLQARGASASGLVPGNSPALAAAQIQSVLRAIVESNGGEVRSTQNLPTSRIEDFEKIDIGCDLSLPMTKLRDVVYQIETRTPYLFIDKVDIRMPENWQPVSDERPAPNLEIRWVVSGYRWTGK